MGQRNHRPDPDVVLDRMPSCGAKVWSVTSIGLFHLVENRIWFLVFDDHKRNIIFGIKSEVNRAGQ